MQNSQCEQEQPIDSQQLKQQKKIKKFREYLVSSGCVTHFVKFLLGLRSKQKHDDSMPSKDVLEMFKDYIGSIQVDTTEQDSIKVKIEELRSHNETLRDDLLKIKEEIKKTRQQKELQKEQKRLKEQEQSKNPKKAGKK